MVVSNKRAVDTNGSGNTLLSFWGTEDQKKKKQVKSKSIADFWVKKDDKNESNDNTRMKEKEKDDLALNDVKVKCKEDSDIEEEEEEIEAVVTDAVNVNTNTDEEKMETKEVMAKEDTNVKTTAKSCTDESKNKDADCNSENDEEEEPTSKRDILVSMWKDKKEKEKNKDKESSREESKASNSKKSSKSKGPSSSTEVSEPTWGKGTAMPYSVITSCFEKIEAISSRLEIQDLLTSLYRQSLQHNPSDMHHLLYLTSNTVAPAYECIELGVGDAILMKALGEASGTNVTMIKQKLVKEGDLGKVAQLVKGRQRTLGFGAKPKPLLANEVLDSLRQIAKTSGAKSQKWKVDMIKGLLVRAQGQEAKYIMKALQGRLRIGLSESTVLISLGHALFLSPPCKTTHSPSTAIPDAESAVKAIRKAYAEVPSYDLLLQAALSAPLDDLAALCSLQPGLPVSPMLAKPTKSILEVLRRLSGLRFTCEYKYDGERAQVHMDSDGATRVFSRNLLETSEKYFEVPTYVKEACKHSNVKSFVLDTEVVAFNRETQQFVPFQILTTRKKKFEDDEAQNEKDVKVQIIVQAFDLMYVNGLSLLNRPFSERRALLHEYFKPIDGKFAFATSIDHVEDGDTILIEEFLDKAVKGQCEGLMVKTLDANATYEPSKRSLNWLKLKKDYLEGLGDSVDLVVLGAYHGRGKRTGVYGAYLLACYDHDTEEFQSVCKIGTGFSDENLKTLATALNQHIIPSKSSQYNVSDALECDVWFDAVHVWEIKAADLSKSSTHKGALNKFRGEAGRGIGLRFPRFERIREDKNPEDATTSDQILEMYYAQESVVAGNDVLADCDEL